jgi:hypothetical protein
MLVVKSIKITFDRGVVPVRFRRLSVAIKKDIRTATKKYLQSDTHTFTWNEDMTLPLYYNVPLRVTGISDDIEENPEHANAELTSFIKIVDYRGTTQFGSLVNLDDRLMGTVAVTYRVANERMVIPEEKGIAVISSILAHFSNQKGSTGYIEISLGHKEVNTPTIKFVAG